MPKILEILVNPNPHLRQKSEKVKAKDVHTEKMHEFSLDMAETMKKKDGIGLAAPQVGKNIRLITVSAKDGVLIMFNPKIIKKSFLKNWEEEGCLSVPFYFGEVRRHKSITCAFIDINGRENKIKASGLLARVIQHEADHLDGILFIDKARELKKIDEIDIKS
ncbi:MAG: peptide deformylase [Patescibacteria group bacterium]